MSEESNLQYRIKEYKALRCFVHVGDNSPVTIINWIQDR